MPTSPVAGIILLVVGVIALVAGIAGGITKLFMEVKKEVQTRSLPTVEFPTELLDALGRFINALATAPLWLALVVLGFLMLAWGGSMF